MTYSLDFRQKVLGVRAKERLTFIETAQRFDIGLARLVRGSKDIAPQKTRNKPATKIDREALKKDIEAYPDADHYERAERLGVSKVCMW